MAFFKPGKIFELQKWTADETLNGKVVGIIDKKNAKQAYPCYVFESQQIISATAAQLTYPELNANSKLKLQQLLDTVIQQKKEHQLNLAQKALDEEQRQILLKKQKEDQQKIQKVLPTVVFDTQGITNDVNGEEIDEKVPRTPSTQIIIKTPPKDLYKTDDDTKDGIVVASEESGVPTGYALVPVSTLNQVVTIKNQSQELQQKELELINKENELTLQQKQTEYDIEKQRMSIDRRKKELEIDKKKVSNMEKEIRRKKDKKYKENERKRDDYDDEKKKKKKKHKDDDDDEKKKKKKKKKRKKKHKDDDDGCTLKCCCKCLCKMSSICFIIAIVAGIIGLYFYFVEDDDGNIYAFLAWAVAIIGAVFGVGFLCKG